MQCQKRRMCYDHIARTRTFICTLTPFLPYIHGCATAEDKNSNKEGACLIYNFVLSHIKFIADFSIIKELPLPTHHLHQPLSFDKKKKKKLRFYPSNANKPTYKQPILYLFASQTNRPYPITV